MIVIYQSLIEIRRFWPRPKRGIKWIPSFYPL